MSKFNKGDIVCKKGSKKEYIILEKVEKSEVRDGIISLHKGEYRIKPKGGSVYEYSGGHELVKV